MAMIRIRLVIKITLKIKELGRGRGPMQISKFRGLLFKEGRYILIAYCLLKINKQSQKRKKGLGEIPQPSVGIYIIHNGEILFPPSRNIEEVVFSL